jgi:DNA replication protein DnaC
MANMTLDVFKAPDATRKTALEQARRFASDPAGWLYFHGHYGCGKTHLLSGIANALMARGHAVLYVVVPELLTYLRAAFDTGIEDGFAARVARIRDAPVLLMDDLGAERVTGWVAEQMYTIVDARYRAELPTAFAANVAPADIGGRLGSRLADQRRVTYVGITSGDYRTAGR